LAGIGIISNPHSKLNKKNPERHNYLSYIAGKEGFVAVTKSLEDLEKVAKDFKESGVKIIAINGGDGTIAHTLTAIIRAWKGFPLPKIALLRGGTINVLAQNLGISGSPEEILFRLIEGYSKGALLDSTTLPCIHVNGVYGFLFANGASANFLEEFYKNKSDKLGSMLLLLKIVFSRFLNKDFFFRIAAASKTELWSQDQLLVREHSSISTLAATIKHMPFGPKLFPKAGKDGEEIQCISYVCSPESLLVPVIKDVLLSPNRPSDAKISCSSRSLTIVTSPPVKYSLDGELYPSCDRVTLELGPEIEFVLI
jgi:diacylglycerol kinase family enzyme